MAGLAGSASVTVTLLMCLLGGEALDLLRETAASGNPHSVPTVHCWCASYPNTTLCTWPEPSQSTPVHYIATYSEKQRQSITHLCHLVTGSAPSGLNPVSSEQLWYCHLPDLKLLTDYILNVTAVYSTGSSSYLSSFMLEDIVKPDPPVDVRVSPRGLRSLLMEWAPPPTWANLEIFPLKYQIQYQWENRGIPMSVDLGPFESTTFELRGLRPGRTYKFKVCAKELLGLGKCSDWSSPVEITVPRTRQ